jgi:ATP-dependent Zn protease
MHEKYTNSSINSPMWWVFGSKIFFAIIVLLAILFFFAPMIASYLTHNTYHFTEINKIIAKEYDSDIFPSFYKLWIEIGEEKSRKFLSLKEVSDYTHLLKKFYESGVRVN